MGRGLISGLIWGSVLSVIVLGIASALAPLPESDRAETAQAELAVPAGSGFTRERAESEPVLPVPDTPPSADTPRPAPPEDETTQSAPPAADTAPADPPDVTAALDQPAVAPEPEDEKAPIAPAVEEPPVEIPDQAVGVPMPEIENPVGSTPKRQFPQIGAPETAAPEAEPAPEPEEPPSVGTGDEEAPGNDAPGTEEQGEETADAARPALGALARNAVGFEAADDRPLMAIVLIDAGGEGLDIDVLKTFSFPVSFAIDPAAPNAATRAADLREAGFEVISLTGSGDAGIPPSAKPADVETALAAYFNTLPQAVGLLDRASGGFARTGPIADAVIAYLADSGHGLLTHDEGLNTTHKKAAREGVPAALVFRSLDAEQEAAPVIKRYLDRAAFRARTEGHVVMLGHSYSDTVTGLFEWALGDQAETVILAPVSAVLRGQ
ncbi:divergent polysaccharide deacetylase family protein [Maritimibacter sp. 55A14]|uniref:divergent polysaccharide deacetylase family protein n=1 Tax=Maritimibacter sp. 55A14 TaxID=2174844 RepID=UPI001304C7FE|nr:divergent polysaccharide deacetylase family protein [Maritimibacter sp. 55A14]